MASFLSTAWLEAMGRAASSDPDLGAVAAGGSLRIQQVVTDPDGGEVAYQLVVADGRASLRPGRADEADVDLTFRTDRVTAIAVHRGDETAQAAFLAGRLEVSGRAVALLDHAQRLAALGDVFGAARDTTSGPAPDPAAGGGPSAG
jgi:hypothetical protein